MMNRFYLKEIVIRVDVPIIDSQYATSEGDHWYPLSQSPRTYFTINAVITGIIYIELKLDLFGICNKIYVIITVSKIVINICCSIL